MRWRWRPGKVSLFRVKCAADDGEPDARVWFAPPGYAGQIIGQRDRRRVSEQVKQRQSGKFVTL